MTNIKMIGRSFNDIQIRAPGFEKVRSHDERSKSVYNHLAACEEFTVRRRSLKMVSVENETHWTSN